MPWFKDLTGFREETPAQVRQNLAVDGAYIVSLVNGNRYKYGALAIPKLQDLRDTVDIKEYQGTLQISEFIGDVQQIHLFPHSKKALIQAASQFNLLEMVGPNITPEQGVGKYEYDRTQGPACAIACGAGTIYRNYFVEVNGESGQTKDNQIDCLSEYDKLWDNPNRQLWTMQNGYALANKDGLNFITQYIQNLSKSEYEHLKGLLKIGIQWDTQVTLDEVEGYSKETPENELHTVSQIYCSALPVAYSHVRPPQLWEAFARLVLDATYEATFYAALQNYRKTGNNIVYLTLVGGGAFGNERPWILDAIKKSIEKFQYTPLDVRIVSYKWSNPNVKRFLNSL